jgi:hypothetical protein
MAGVLPAHILVHTATPVSYVEGVAGDEWIEGEPGEGGPQPVEGVPFECVLFLPSPGGEEASPYKPRVVRRPTLLYNPDRNLVDPARGLVGDGSDVLLTNEDELMILAPELSGWTGAALVRWQADGDSQPFGPPGEVFGVMATLLQVKG